MTELDNKIASIYETWDPIRNTTLIFDNSSRFSNRMVTTSQLYPNSIKVPGQIYPSYIEISEPEEVCPRNNTKHV